MVKIAHRDILRGRIQTRSRLFVSSALARIVQDRLREPLSQPKPALVVEFGLGEGLFPDRCRPDERFAFAVVVNQSADFAGDVADGWVDTSFSHSLLLASCREPDGSLQQPKDDA
jgi:hypothetical protein